MSQLEKHSTARKMNIVRKNVSQLEKWASVRKMCIRQKNGSQLKKHVTARKMSIEKCVIVRKMDHSKNMCQS